MLLKSQETKIPFGNGNEFLDLRYKSSANRATFRGLHCSKHHYYGLHHLLKSLYMNGTPNNKMCEAAILPLEMKLSSFPVLWISMMDDDGYLWSFSEL